MGIFWFFMVVVLGTTVFKLSGDLTLIDALYLTVVSASTVGYGTHRLVQHTAGPRELLCSHLRPDILPCSDVAQPLDC